MKKTLIRSSDIGQYVWCPYALELAMRGVAPAAKEMFAQGDAVHERISDKVYAGTMAREHKLGWSAALAIIFAAIALLLYILLRGLL